MGTRNTVRGIPALLLVTAGLALAACGTSDDQDPAAASSPTPASSSAPASDTPSPAPPPSSTTPASSSAPADKPSTAGSGSGAGAGSTVAGCTTSHLKVTATSNGSGAGSTFYELVFQNTGSAPCTLRGYPGVSFVKAHDTQLGKAAERTGGTATTTVTLIPNAHAYADLRTVNGVGGYSKSQCGLTDVPSLRIYPPNQKASVDIAWNKPECVGSSVQNLQVGTVHTKR